VDEVRIDDSELSVVGGPGDVTDDVCDWQLIIYSRWSQSWLRSTGRRPWSAMMLSMDTRSQRRSFTVKCRSSSPPVSVSHYQLSITRQTVTRQHWRTCLITCW